ncbi:hypothetical protein GWK08_14970 [Leptobacterium flavescens]|uniref:Transporter n=1 Tax=Leptobacterium flavescens TaxID=472055 RepID=A0A6P0UP45_9FLAO|nr:hypothetical protein [Leptobacterium flavescens]NER14757.1 hypothetical protein [Leptobacterium flavescens]
MKKLTLIITLLFLAVVQTGFAQQDDDTQTRSNLIEFTPSKLLYQNQWDIKWFNNLFTTTTFVNEDGDKFSTGGRQNFFTSTFEIFHGVSKNRRVNLGVIFEVRSNTIGGRGVFDVFSFDGEDGTARSGITTIAPSIKFQPFKNISNFSIQSSFFIPLIDNEVENGVFLDEKSFVWQNRFFYDYVFPGNKFQVFSELNTEFNFGETRVFDNIGTSTIQGGFANESLRLSSGTFFSYFPSQRLTLQVLVQQFFLIDLGNNFDQNFSAAGAGIKYQLTDELSVETLYTNFFRARDANTGQTFNIGLRVIL